MADPYRIRPASAADVPEIAAAERICFSDPWSSASLAELFENDTAIGLIAASSGPEFRLAGYVFARVIAGEAEILNIAVVPGDRSQGVGATLLDAVLERIRGRGAAAVFLEVRESNEPARRLYLSRGFRPVGLRADYYRRPRENAVVLRLNLGSEWN